MGGTVSSLVNSNNIQESRNLLPPNPQAPPSPSLFAELFEFVKQFPSNPSESLKRIWNYLKDNPAKLALVGVGGMVLGGAVVLVGVGMANPPVALAGLIIMVVGTGLLFLGAAIGIYHSFRPPVADVNN